MTRWTLRRFGVHGPRAGSASPRSRAALSDGVGVDSKCTNGRHWPEKYLPKQVHTSFSPLLSNTVWLHGADTNRFWGCLSASYVKPLGFHGQCGLVGNGRMRKGSPSRSLC